MYSKFMNKTAVLAVMTFALGTGANALAAHDGPGISGGGNGLLGKPLESYALDMSRTPEFQQYVQPVLQQLRQKLPGLENDLRRVLGSKNVYLVPELLPTVPSYILGVSFRTDQLALQTIGSIWIDSTLYAAMSGRDRAMLLMHEMVMGLKLTATYSGWECVPSRANQRCRGADLDRNDYEAVRRLTYVLMTELDKYPAKDLQTVVAAWGFGKYDVPLDNGAVEPVPSFEHLYLILSSENRQGALPYASADGRGCGYEFKLDSTRKSLTVSIYDSIGRLPRKDQLPFSVEIRGEPQLSKNLKSATYTYVDLSVSPMMGAFRKRIDIVLNGESILAIKAYWEEYDYDYRSRNYVWKESLSGPSFTVVREAKVCRI